MDAWVRLGADMVQALLRLLTATSCLFPRNPGIFPMIIRFCGALPTPVGCADRERFLYETEISRQRKPSG